MLALPSFHPAYLLRSADGAQGQARFESTVIGDLKRALALTKRKPDWNEEIIWKRDEQGRLVNLFPTLTECIAYFQRNYQSLNACDIETTGEEPLDCQILCVGFASALGDAICIPILQPGGASYWEPEEKKILDRMLAYFLQAKNTPKVFQNGSFDTIVLGAHGYYVDGWFDDTMAAHHVLEGELPHSLAFIGSVFSEVPYYKDEVKGDDKWINKDAETLRSYNIRDCLTTLRALPPLIADLKKHQLYDLYLEELAVTKVMVKATLRGVFVDLEARDSENPVCVVDWKKLKKARAAGTPLPEDPGQPYGIGPQMVLIRDAALGKLRALAGHPEFNPGSPVQLKWLLFEHLKFPVVKQTKKGAPSTDKEAMILLALHIQEKEQEAALDALIKWRRASKVLSTWIRGFHPNRFTGRIHAMWKLLTVTGRLASSPNMQNLNSRIKRMFRAGPGLKFVAIDLSQAELRGMSYFAHDDEVLKMYEQNMNIHTINTTLLFGVRNPGVDSNPATEGYLVDIVPKFLKTKDGKPQNYLDLPQPPEKKWSRMRRLAKNFRFGWQYKAIAETIYKVLRSDRDPDTDKPVFPDLTLGEVEACKLKTEQMSSAVVRYWQTVEDHVNQIGYYRTPLSGRIRWYRAGPKANEIVNFPIQATIADWMNKCLLRIAARLEAETNDEAQIIMQVHDSLIVETPDKWIPAVQSILTEELSRTFKLHEYENATFPPDKPTVGIWLDEV